MWLVNNDDGDGGLIRWLYFKIVGGCLPTKLAWCNLLHGSALLQFWTFRFRRRRRNRIIFAIPFCSLGWRQLTLNLTKDEEDDDDDDYADDRSVLAAVQLLYCLPSSVTRWLCPSLFMSVGGKFAERKVHPKCNSRQMHAREMNALSRNPVPQ